MTPACISSPFGPRRLVGPRAATFHNGIDFPAPVGAYVHAVAPGKVATIQRRGAKGLKIDVRHTLPGRVSFLTRYVHLVTVTPALAGGSEKLAGRILIDFT